MRRIAHQHDLMFLAHEKPFVGINGSGKHNNWSMATDEGENLLDPGHNPHDNAQFLAFLAAVMRAVNVHADILRASVADAGNDHRLGANEAPPAIVSIFLGAQLEDVVEQLEKGAASTSKAGGTMTLGVTTLPVLPRDATDRNRTSPFAFTGNKFEFRSVGSSAPIYWPQTALNTAVADSLEKLADELDKLESCDFEGLTKILSGIIKENKQILFEGNNYAEEWYTEAAKRGLPNNRSTVDALPALATAKAKKVFSHFGVLSERELASRVEIAWERYVKVSNIEANCALDMAKTMILPAAVKYLGQLGAAGDSKGVEHMASTVAALTDQLVDAIHALEHAQHAAHEAGSVHAEAKAFKEQVIPAQEALRGVADELETLVADDLWPLPKYRELLFQY
jgi:glutamine synthetase